MALRRSTPLLCPVSGAAGSGMTVARQQHPAPNVLFMERREKIVADLRENRNDKSLAGRVDPQVAPLVEFINERFRCYVTLSSCSGRASLFHKGQVLTAVEPQRAGRKRGAFGQGALFQSHDPFSDVGRSVDHELIPALESFADWRRQQQQQHEDDSLIHETELLQFKFEPTIVHVLCETMDDAARLLQCASESGQMDSGVISCSRGTCEHRKITCCITSSLCVDIPLFAQGRWLLGHASFSRPEWKALLTNTVANMNTLFRENEEVAMELLSWKRYDDKYGLSHILTEAARSCVDAHTGRPEEYLAAYFTEKCSGDEIRAIVTRAVYLPSGTIVLRLTLQLLNRMEAESAAFVLPSHGEDDAAADETTDPTTYTTEALQKSYFPRLLQCGARDQKGFDTTLRQLCCSAEGVDVGVSVIYGLSTLAASAAARCSSVSLFMYLRRCFSILGESDTFAMPQLCISFFGPENPSTARLALRDVLLIPAMPEGFIPSDIIQKIFAAFHHFCRAHNTTMRSDGSLAYDDIENVTDAVGLAEEAVRAVGLTPVRDVCIGLRFAATVASPTSSSAAITSAAAWKDNKDAAEVMYTLFPGDADVSGAQVSEYVREQLQNRTDFVVYVEDTHCDRDASGLQRLQAHLGECLTVSGRDLYGRSQYKKVEHGLRGLWTSNFVVDPGVVGTLSDVHEIVRRVKECEGRCVSFVTQDLVGNAAMIAHLSVAVEARFLCMGGLLSTPQCEVLSHLMSIQSELLHSRLLCREAPKIPRMELPRPPTDVVPEIKRRTDKKKRKK